MCLCGGAAAAPSQTSVTNNNKEYLSVFLSQHGFFHEGGEVLLVVSHSCFFHQGEEGADEEEVEADPPKHEDYDSDATRCIVPKESDVLNVAKHVLGWDTCSKFSTDPSKLESNHESASVDDVDSETSFNIHNLRPFDDILVQCGEGNIPAQVVTTGSDFILVKYYTSYKVGGSLRYKIVGTVPYEVEFNEYLRKLDHLVKRSSLCNPRMQDLNMVFTNFPRAKRSVNTTADNITRCLKKMK